MSLTDFLHARFARFPDGGAQAVELRFDAAERSVFLNQIDAREGNVEFRVAGKLQQHEFAVRAFDGDLAQAFELADAVIDVDHVVAGFQIAEIAEETRGFGTRARALGGAGSVSKRSALP